MKIPMQNNPRPRRTRLLAGAAAVAALLLLLAAGTLAWFTAKQNELNGKVTMGKIKFSLVVYQDDGVNLATSANSTVTDPTDAAYDIASGTNWDNDSTGRRYLKITNDSEIDIKTYLTLEITHSTDLTDSQINNFYFALTDITDTVTTDEQLKSYATANPADKLDSTTVINTPNSKTGGALKGDVRANTVEKGQTRYYCLDYCCINFPTESLIQTTTKSDTYIQINAEVTAKQANAPDSATTTQGITYPVGDWQAFLQAARSATDGDTILLTGDIDAETADNILFARAVNLSMGGHTLTLQGDLGYDFAQPGTVYIDTNSGGKLRIGGNLSIDTPNADVTLAGGSNRSAIVVGTWDGTKVLNGGYYVCAQNYILNAATVQKVTGAETTTNAEMRIGARTEITVQSQTFTGVLKADSGASMIKINNKGFIDQIDLSAMAETTSAGNQIRIINAGTVYTTGDGGVQVKLPNWAKGYLHGYTPELTNGENAQARIYNDYGADPIKTIANNGNLFTVEDIESAVPDTNEQVVHIGTNSYRVTKKSNDETLQGLLKNYFDNNGTKHPTETLDTIEKLVLVSADGAEYTSFVDTDTINNDHYCFASLANLKSLDLTDALFTVDKTTGKRTLKGSDKKHFNNLTEVILPKAETAIGKYAFLYNQLSRVVIPSTVTVITNNAFAVKTENKNALEFVWDSTTQEMPSTTYSNLSGNFRNGAGDPSYIVMNSYLFDSYMTSGRVGKLFENYDYFDSTSNCYFKVLSADTARITMYMGNFDEDNIVPETVKDTAGREYTVTEIGKDAYTYAIRNHLGNVTADGYSKAATVKFGNACIKVDKYAFMGTDQRKIAFADGSSDLSQLQTIGAAAFNRVYFLQPVKLTATTVEYGTNAFSNATFKNTLDVEGGALPDYTLENIKVYGAVTISGGELGFEALQGCTFYNSASLKITGGVLSGNHLFYNANINCPVEISGGSFTSDNCFSSTKFGDTVTIKGGDYVKCPFNNNTFSGDVIIAANTEKQLFSYPQMKDGTTFKISQGVHVKGHLVEGLKLAGSAQFVCEGENVFDNAGGNNATISLRQYGMTTVAREDGTVAEPTIDLQGLRINTGVAVWVSNNNPASVVTTGGKIIVGNKDYAADGKEYSLGSIFSLDGSNNSFTVSELDVVSQLPESCQLNGSDNRVNYTGNLAGDFHGVKKLVIADEVTKLPAGFMKGFTPEEIVYNGSGFTQIGEKAVANTVFPDNASEFVNKLLACPSIGNYAFNKAEMQHISSLTFGSANATWGSYVFAEAKLPNLTELNFANNFNVPDYMFYNAKLDNLTTLDLTNCQTVGDYAFSASMPKLATINASDIERIGCYAFVGIGTSGTAVDVDMSNVVFVGRNALSYGTTEVNLGKLTIGVNKDGLDKINTKYSKSYGLTDCSYVYSYYNDTLGTYVTDNGADTMCGLLASPATVQEVEIVGNTPLKSANNNFPNTILGASDQSVYKHTYGKVTITKDCTELARRLFYSPQENLVSINEFVIEPADVERTLGEGSLYRVVFAQSKLDFGWAKADKQVFYYTKGLKTVTFTTPDGQPAPIWLSEVFGYSSIESAVFNGVFKFDGLTFRYANNLQSVRMNYNGVNVTGVQEANTYTNSTVKFYVPTSVLESYKTDGYWKAIANRFAALDQFNYSFTDEQGTWYYTLAGKDSQEIYLVSYTQGTITDGALAIPATFTTTTETAPDDTEPADVADDATGDSDEAETTDTSTNTKPYTVIGLAANLFDNVNLADVTTLTIPATVYDFTFETFDSSLTTLPTITFAAEDNFKVVTYDNASSILTSDGHTLVGVLSANNDRYVVPDSVTAIAAQAFRNISVKDYYLLNTAVTVLTVDKFGGVFTSELTNDGRSDGYYYQNTGPTLHIINGMLQSYRRSPFYSGLQFAMDGVDGAPEGFSEEFDSAATLTAATSAQLLTAFAPEDAADPDIFTITYVMSDGTNPGNTPTTYTPGTGYVQLPTPTRDGYTFAGWYTTPLFDGTPATLLDTDAGEGDVTYYAKWVKETSEDSVDSPDITPTPAPDEDAPADEANAAGEAESDSTTEDVPEVTPDNSDLTVG